MSGGVGGGSREVSPYPDYQPAPLRLGAIFCSIEVQPNVTYYVKYVTHQH